MAKVRGKEYSRKRTYSNIPLWIVEIKESLEDTSAKRRFNILPHYYPPSRVQYKQHIRWISGIRNVSKSIPIFGVQNTILKLSQEVINSIVEVPWPARVVFKRWLSIYIT